MGAAHKPLVADVDLEALAVELVADDLAAAVASLQGRSELAFGAERGAAGRIDSGEIEQARAIAGRYDLDRFDRGEGGGRDRGCGPRIGGESVAIANAREGRGDGCEGDEDDQG